MIQMPTNKLVIEVDQQFTDHIDFKSGVRIYYDTRLEKQDKVSLTARVVSLPRVVKPWPGQEEMSLDHLEPGSTIMIRYDVLAENHDQPENDTARYKNEVLVDSEKYWLCDIEQVFAVWKLYWRFYPSGRSETGFKWWMVNDYIKVKPLIEDKGEKMSKLILRPEHYRTEEFKGRGLVQASSTEGVDEGDEVLFIHSLAQRYQENDEAFYIIRKRHVIATKKRKK